MNDIATLGAIYIAIFPQVVFNKRGGRGQTDRGTRDLVEGKLRTLPRCPGQRRATSPGLSGGHRHGQRGQWSGGAGP